MILIREENQEVVKGEIYWVDLNSDTSYSTFFRFNRNSVYMINDFLIKKWENINPSYEYYL